MDKLEIQRYPWRNEIQKGAVTGQLDPTVGYLVIQPPIDTDAYIYAGEWCVKGR